MMMENTAPLTPTCHGNRKNRSKQWLTITNQDDVIFALMLCLFALVLRKTYQADASIMKV
jgi:hypothetical protein